MVISSNVLYTVSMAWGISPTTSQAYVSVRACVCVCVRARARMMIYKELILFSPSVTTARVTPESWWPFADNKCVFSGRHLTRIQFNIRLLVIRLNESTNHRRLLVNDLFSLGADHIKNVMGRLPIETSYRNTSSFWDKPTQIRIKKDHTNIIV